MGVKRNYSSNFFQVEDEIIGRIDARNKKRTPNPKNKPRRRRRKKK